MRYILLLTSILAIAACSKNPEYLNNDFVAAYKIKTSLHSKLKYNTRSTFYKDSTGAIRFTDSNLITHRLISIKDLNNSTIYTWESLPGANKKDVPDTLFNEINEKGIFTWFNSNLFEGSAERNNTAPFPLKEGQSWKSKFLFYPANATCIDVDTLIQTKAGQFHCYRIDYTFSPEYMYEEFIKDSINNEIKGVYSAFNSDYGLIYSSISYVVTNKNDPTKKWTILTNTTSLTDIMSK